MTTSSLWSLLKRSCSGFAFLVVVLLAACDSPEKSVREIRENLNAFQRQPNIITLDTLNKSFIKIDEQIQRLVDDDRINEADLYRRQAMLMREEYLQTRNNFLKMSQRQSRQQAESQ